MQITDQSNTSLFAMHLKQFGFRANYSTEMASFYFTEKVKSSLDNGGIIGAVWLDLKKAFDTANHMCKLIGFHFIFTLCTSTVL